MAATQEEVERQEEEKKKIRLQGELEDDYF
jgi:hypothetical protein